MIENHRSIYRVVKGAPLTVLIAMLELGGEAGVDRICQLTTYTDKTVSRALDALSDAGLVTKTNRFNGWTLTMHGKQIPFTLVGNRGGENLRLGVGEISSVVNAVKPLSLESFESLDTPEPTTTPREISPTRLAALREVGISGKVRDELAADDFLTPEYIRGHNSMRQEDGLGTGMLVVRLRGHDPLPKRFLKPPCPECGRCGKHDKDCGRKFYDSAYSEE